MGLFGPPWDTSNPRKKAKAIAYVDRVSDEAELIEIATHAKMIDVAVAAVNRLSNREALASVFRKGNSWICDEAGNRIRKAGSASVLRAAVQRMDADDLASIAHEGGGQIDGEVLVECLDMRESVLVEIADNDGWPLDVRLLALDKIGEPNPRVIYELLDKVYSIQDESYGRYKELGETIKRAMKRTTDHGALTSYLLEGGTTHEGLWEWRNPLSDMMGILSKDELTSIVRATPKASGVEVAWEKLEPLLSENELSVFACDPDFQYQKRACERLGHERGERCVCSRCGKQLNHEIEGDACRCCGGRVETTTEPGEWERIYSNFEIYDSNHNKVTNPRTRRLYTRTYLCHEDGARQLLDERFEEENSW